MHKTVFDLSTGLEGLKTVSAWHCTGCGRAQYYAESKEASLPAIKCSPIAGVPHDLFLATSSYTADIKRPSLH